MSAAAKLLPKGLTWHRCPVCECPLHPCPTCAANGCTTCASERRARGKR